MKMLRRIGGIVAAATIGLMPLTLSSPAEAASKKVDGCPRGDVCLYERDASQSSSHLQRKYFDYGVYNLHSVYGKHWIMNNQYSSAYVTLYKKSNGHGKCFGFKTGSGPTSKRYNFTPINSIRLSKHLPSGCSRA